MFGLILLRIVAILCCFLFGAGNAAAAAKAFYEQKWDEVGCNIMLTGCFMLGIALISHMWIMG